MHKVREHQQPLYMCFVDFQEAFYSISCDRAYVLCNYDGHGISSALDWLAGQTIHQTAR